MIANMDAARSAAEKQLPQKLRAGPCHPAEFVLTETPRPGEPVAAMFLRLAASLQQRNAQILALMIYGGVTRQPEIDRAMQEALGEADWPVTWVEAASCDGAALAGIQAFALSGQSVTRIRIGRRVVGSVFEDEGARHCLLGGLGPQATSLAPAAQVQQMFSGLELALDMAGFALSDVARTWFYNDDILPWSSGARVRCRPARASARAIRRVRPCRWRCGRSSRWRARVARQRLRRRCNVRRPLTAVRSAGRWRLMLAGSGGCWFPARRAYIRTDARLLWATSDGRST
jgi:hypothetical protein